MKIRKFLSLLFLIVLTISCGSDSEDNTGTNNPDDPTAGNKLGLGRSANDLLSDDAFTTMTIEVLIADGVQASSQALNDLEAFLEARTFKTNVVINTRSFPSPGPDEFSIDNVRDLEDNNRTAFNADSDIAVFILYLDGSSENDEGNSVTLGTAYRNTSMVIYKETIDFAGNMVNTPSTAEIESATLQHEFGHLLGLVDIGSPAQSDHEDVESAAHCNVDGCLMIASLEFLSGMIGMSTIPELDALCIEDLQANGGR